MYKEHKAFETPPHTCTVWRYMSFAKFVWLIARESLYFSRLDQHDDWWEGLLPRNWNIEHRKYVRFTKYINCWHMNDSESDAMWKLYGNSAGETVAIKTTVGGLIKSLETSATPVYIGKMKYEERDRPEGNLYLPVTYKRKPFRHEKELRLCVSSASNDNPPDLAQLKQALAPLGIDNRSDVEILKEIGDKGIQVPVDLNQLIHEVVICPNSKHSLSDSVQYIMAGKVSHTRIRESKI
jgi:hypothetical protein